VHAADDVFDPAAMARSRHALATSHGNMTTYKVLIDQAEVRIHQGRDGYFLNGETWYGGDIDRLRLTTEVEGSFGRSPEHAEVQALWSHALNPWFNLQTGVRADLRPDPERAHLVLGIQGLAPYWLDVEAAAFLSTRGELTARVEGEYDQRITAKLILQPHIELNLAAQDIPRLGIGSGLSTAEAGLRLRYQLVPEFAPYVGVVYERAFGDAADFRRSEGERIGGWSFVLGVRTWF